MSKAKPNYLKLHVEEPPNPTVPETAALGRLPDLCRSFEQATGWSLQYSSGPAPLHDRHLMWSAPVEPGVGTSPGHFRIDLEAAPPDGVARIDVGPALELAGVLAAMTEQLIRAETTVWRREAELAAGVPVAPHRQEEEHLAARLEALLAAAVDAVGADAAGLYLLDADTKELKLRSLWGLSRDRLHDPPRPLRDALADLEALLGHAVVLEDTSWYQHWSVPEEFAAAVCVPVSTPTIPLGTLWLFSNETRDFDDRQTNLIEVIAGRLAAELEREMLLSSSVEDARLKRQLASAQRMQQQQLPRIAPLLEGWDLAAWNEPADTLGGDFYDWFWPTRDLLSISLGDALAQGLDAALGVTALRTAVRAHGEYLDSPDEVLARVNRSLWTGSPGDITASLFYATIDVASGLVRFATAGDLVALRLGAKGWCHLVEPQLALGIEPEASFALSQVQLAPGEVLVLATDGVRDAQDAGGRRLGESGLVQALLPHLSAPAETLLELARDELESFHSGNPRDDRSVLILRREGAVPGRRPAGGTD